MSVPVWIDNLDTGGGAPDKVQLRTDGEYVIIRVGGPRGEEIRIKAKYFEEVLYQCQT